MANKKKIAVEREFPEELMDSFRNRENISQFSDVDAYLQTLNEMLSFLKGYPSTGFAPAEGSEFFTKELGNKKYLIETKYKELFNEVIKAIKKLKEVQGNLKDVNISIDKINGLLDGIKNTRAPRKPVEPEVKPDVTPEVKPDVAPATPEVDAEAARREETAAQVDFDDALVAEDRYFRAREELAALEAKVEAAKADYERAMAKFDAHYSGIHEAEAAVHDAKAAEQELLAGKKPATPKVDQAEPEIKPNFTDEHRKEIEETQLRAAQTNLVNALARTVEKLDRDEHLRRVSGQQNEVAAQQVARVARDNAETAEREAHRVRVRNRQRVSAAQNAAELAKAREEAAKARRHAQEIAYQQGLAVGRDLSKVAKVYATDQETLDEVERVVRNNNLSNSQGVAASKDAEKVAVNDAKNANDEYRKAKIYDQQGRAAGDDTVRVAGHNAEVTARSAHAEHVKNVQGAAAYRDARRVVDGPYRLTGRDIIQNLPVNSPLNEVLETPGMTEAEIEESKRKLAEVPEKKATPTKTWVEMSKSINQLLYKKETGNIDLTPDDIYALYFLRRHPEAAPSQKVLNELLVWAGVSPLEVTTPRKDAPAQTQTPRKDAAPVNPTRGTDPVPPVAPTKGDEVITPATDAEIAVIREKLNNSERTKGDEPITPASDADLDDLRKKVKGDEPVTPADDDDLDALRGLLDPTGEPKKGEEPKTEEPKKGEEPKAEEPKKGEEPKAEEPKKGEEPKAEEPKKGEDPKKEDPKKEDDKSKKGKGKKVKKRTNVKGWFATKFLTLKALIFGERMNGRSKSYIAFSVAIGNLKGQYKSNTPEENNQILKNLNDKIKADATLTPEESKLLYKKYCKLYKQIEKYNRKHAGKTVATPKAEKKAPVDDVDDELQAAIDETMEDIFGEEVGRGR